MYLSDLPLRESSPARALRTQIPQDDQKKAPGCQAGAEHTCCLSRATYCTFAVICEFAFNVSVHVLALLPPLEHAPLQIASRPLVTLSVTAVPGANCAEPVLPVATLRPAGFERMRSPLRPPAVTASDMVVGATAGFRVRVAERVTPPPETEIVARVCALTAAVLMKKPPVVLPAGIRTEVAVNDAAGLLLLICSV